MLARRHYSPWAIDGPQNPFHFLNGDQIAQQRCAIFAFGDDDAADRLKIGHGQA
ncbi:MAG: hypothetical protein JXQ79_12240 [Rhodobacteraceae bacterium]|nr:hypothetical protein [Paracoccaceae bacterium]